MNANRISLLRTAAVLATAGTAAAELPRYGVSLVSDVYPGLQVPWEMPFGLTAGGAVVTGSALAGQAYAITMPGGARTDIPAIPAAPGYGDTGGNRIYNDSGGFTASRYNNTFESTSTEFIPHVYDAATGWSSLGRPQAVNAIATALNNTGQVLAAGLDNDNDESSAWRHTPGTGWLNLGNLGHSSGFAFGSDLNDAGTVIGRSADTLGNLVPFYYTDAGGMQAITDNGGAVFGRAEAINNAGLVTGTGNGRAFIFNAQTMEFRYITEAAQGISAVDINDAGAVLGISGSGNLSFVTLYREDFGLVSLSSLLEGNEDPFNPAWLMKDAVDINDNGWILGTAQRVSDNTFHQVLLRPVPEPGMAVLLASAAVIMFRRQRSRCRWTSFPLP
jgi:hypothetical protein